jgi:hypothetical protein
MRKADLPASLPAPEPEGEAVMTSNDQTVTKQSQPPGWVLWIRSKLDPVFTPARREAINRALSAIIIGLTATGTLTADKAALWTQLGVAGVGLLFALLYAGTSVRAALYSVIVVGSSLLAVYGIAQNVDWAIIVACVGQAFGITTAAAKAQPPQSG